MTDKIKPAPMATALEAAIIAACRSPCQKSKRGAVVFHPFTGQVCTPAWNSRPDNRCDSYCQPQIVNGPRSIVLEQNPSRCAMMCVHAEARAIRFARAYETRSLFVSDGDYALNLIQCELVHIKVDGVTGNPVPTGPPSCWQCAKEIADNLLFGVWLFEQTSGSPVWNFYPRKEFYERTMKECELG